MLFGKRPSAASSFARDRRGTTAILFGLAAIPLMGIIGAAADYAAATRQQARLSNAVDAAILSAVSSHLTGTAVQSRVEDYIRANLGGVAANQTLAVTASADSSGMVTATASLTSPTWIMKMFGRPTATVTVTAKAAPGPAEKLEVALALDTTGSMAGAKLDGVKTAARDLVTTLFTSPDAASNVRIGLVPFTYYVNVGTTYRGATWLTNTQDTSTTSSDCTTIYPDAQYLDPVVNTYTCYNDGIPSQCSYTTYNTIIPGAPQQYCSTTTYTNAWYGCVGSRAYPLDLQEQVDSASPVPGLLNVSCSAPLARLTSSVSSLHTQINALSAWSETYIAPALLWSWRLLSPAPPFADAAAYGATKKYVVLMTDGANTRAPSYPDHGSSDAGAANTLTAQTCANIKAKGVKIYTIAFDVTDAAIKNILSACATTTADYYDSATITDMQAAFAAIGAKIGSVRLIR